MTTSNTRTTIPADVVGEETPLPAPEPAGDASMPAAAGAVPAGGGAPAGELAADSSGTDENKPALLKEKSPAS